MNFIIRLSPDVMKGTPEWEALMVQLDLADVTAEKVDNIMLTVCEVSINNFPT